MGSGSERSADLANGPDPVVCLRYVIKTRAGLCFNYLVVRGAGIGESIPVRVALEVRLLYTRII
jgi:hypothetical protein